MLIALISHLSISWLSHWLFTKKYLATDWDVFNCFKEDHNDTTISSYKKNFSDEEGKIASNDCNYRLSGDSSQVSRVTQFELANRLPNLGNFKYQGNVNPVFSEEDL